MSFRLLATEDGSRRGILSTAHGEIETPVSLRPDNTTYFFFYDPEGNRIELCRH